MFKRIRNLIELSNYVPSTERLLNPSTGEITAKVTLEKDEPTEPAEFFSEGTEEDFKIFEREEKGLKGLFGLKK